MAGENPSSPEGGDAQGDDKQIQLAEQNTKLAEKLERTAEQVASIAQHVATRPAPAPAPAPAAAQPEPRLTEEQVMSLVESKHVSLAQAMAYLRKCSAEDAQAVAARTTAQALAEVGSRAAEQQLAQQIGRYMQAVPNLGKRGSPEWNEVAERFQELVNEGYASTLQTELQALRELYGRNPAAAEPPRERTKERAARAVETPSSSSTRTAAPRRPRGEGGDGLELPADHKTYVEHMIRIGQYKGWSDPKVAKYAERVRAKG